MQKKRYIIHVDMDAFFAAVEQRDNPSLRGMPVVVGADPKAGKGRGVVSTCSYEARKFGIHSAMPISIAFRKCPDAVFLPVDSKKYHKVSEEMYEIFYDFTPDIEPVSIDEAFLDITGTFHLFGTPYKTCQMLKACIKENIGITASIGLAPTKMAAKIASDFKKPDGLVEVFEERLLDFLWPLDIGKIWGLGKKTKTALNEIGIITVGDLAKREVVELAQIFGKSGMHLWELANGKDARVVEAQEETKSVSNEITFPKDTFDRDTIEKALLTLSEKVSSRLRDDNLKGRTVTFKIRLEGFNTYTRANTVGSATNFVDVIYDEVKRLYLKFNRGGRKVRLIGVKISNLMPADYRDNLFVDETEDKLERIHQAADRIKKKFGDASIKRAGGRF